MTTVAVNDPRTDRPIAEAVSRLFTVADVAVLPAELPSGPVRYELDNGRLIAMPPAGGTHEVIEGNLIAALQFQGEAKGLGKARCGDVGIILWRHPDRLVGADAVFVASHSLPIRHSSEGYLETIPELVVEVLSKNDTMPAASRKVQDYLWAGVRLVWLVDPEGRTITVYQPGDAPVVLGENDTLTAEGTIPGFSLAVRDALAE